MATASSRLAPTIDFFQLPVARCTVCEQGFPQDKNITLPDQTTKAQAKELKHELDSNPLSVRSSSIFSKENRRDIKARFPKIDSDDYLKSLKFKVGVKTTLADATTQKTSFVVGVREPIWTLSCDCVTVDNEFTHPLFYHHSCLSQIKAQEGSVTCRKCHQIATWHLFSSKEEATTREERHLTIQEAQIPKAECTISLNAPRSHQRMVVYPCNCKETQIDGRYVYKKVQTVDATARDVLRQLELLGVKLNEKDLKQELINRKFSCITCGHSENRDESFWLSKPLRETLEPIILGILEKNRGASVASGNVYFTPFGTPEFEDLQRLREAYRRDTHSEFHRHALLTLTDQAPEGYADQAAIMLEEAERDAALLDASVVTLMESTQQNQEISRTIKQNSSVAQVVAADADEEGYLEQELAAALAGSTTSHDDSNDGYSVYIRATNSGNHFEVVDEDEDGVVVWDSSMMNDGDEASSS